MNSATTLVTSHNNEGAQLVAQLFKAEADDWQTIYPRHFINMVFLNEGLDKCGAGGEIPSGDDAETAGGSHACRVAGISKALKAWRGRDQLLGYASRHSRDPAVMANLRLFAERLTQSEGDAAADRYDTTCERGAHLEAVFGCDGHEDLQEKWSTLMPTSGYTSFEAFQTRGGVDITAELCGGTVAERVAAAADQVRTPLHMSLVIDKHVGDATRWLPNCLNELDPRAVGTMQPATQPPPDDGDDDTAQQQPQLVSQLDTMLVELLRFNPAAIAAASDEPDEALVEQQDKVNEVVEQLKRLIKTKPTTQRGGVDAAKQWGQLLNDVQDIANSLKRSVVAIDDIPEWTIGITDDSNVLFMIGTDVAGSCQHATGSPTLNKCLMSYVLDGKTKAVVICRPGTRPGELGKPVTIGRCIVRLVLHDAKPALAVSRFYAGSKYRSENVRRMFGVALRRCVAEEAARLGVHVVRSSDPGVVLSLGGVGPEYVDECEGVNIKPDAKWEMAASQLEGCAE
jgi:hypothetical protein